MVTIYQQGKLATLEGFGVYDGHGQGYGQFGGLMSSALTAYNKIKKANLLSSSAPDTEKALRRIIGAGQLLGDVRTSVMTARAKGIDTGAVTVKFEMARGRLNNTMRELQQHVKAKTGRHVKMPYVNPIGSGPAMNFAGMDFADVSLLMQAVAGLKKLVSIPASLVKKVINQVKSVEDVATDANKQLIAQILADESKTPAQKAEEIAAVEATAEEMIEETGDEGGFFDKMRQRVEDALGITKLKDRGRKIAWGVGITAILATTWYIYRRTQGKPFIPRIGAGTRAKALSGGFMGDQTNKMKGCARAWQSSGKTEDYKDFMSACLRGKSSAMMGGFGSLFDGSAKPRKKSRRKKSRREGSSFGAMSPAMRRQQNKMMDCARDWRESGKQGKYKTFMSRCLKD